MGFRAHNNASLQRPVCCLTCAANARVSRLPKRASSAGTEISHLIRSVAATLAIALLPATAFAQADFEGLDLTDGPKKKPDEAKPAEPVAPATPSTSASAPATNRSEASKADEGSAGERDITREDRVKSVQRKLYLKKGRFELAPYVSTSINDPYYTKFGVALRGAYYIADTVAVSARFSLMQTLPTEDVRTAKNVFQSRIFFSVPYWSLMGDLEWSPIYGKVSFLNSILHFDAYALAGAGAVTTETSNKDGMHLAGDLGVGMRFVAKDFLAVNVALINTSYVDQPTGTTKGVTQNVMTLNVGLSLFFPFKSTFREAE